MLNELVDGGPGLQCTVRGKVFLTILQDDVIIVPIQDIKPDLRLRLMEGQGFPAMCKHGNLGVYAVFLADHLKNVRHIVAKGMAVADKQKFHSARSFG